MSISQSEWIRYAEDCRFHFRVERIEKELKEVLKSMIKEPRNPISDLFEGVFLSSKGENTMSKKPKFKVGDNVRVNNDILWKTPFLQTKGILMIKRYNGFDNTYLLTNGFWYEENMLKLINVSHKFKVGDKIIGNKKANRYNFTKEGWIGTVVTVYDRRNVFGNDIEAKGENGTTYPVNSDCFDLYNPSPNYKLVITSDDGKTTTARYYEDNKKISEAKATCHEEDEFDFDTGAVIALTRAIKGVDNVEVCIKNSSELAEEVEETEWDKFKKDKIAFVVYQKDIEKFLDVCAKDNIRWRINNKFANDWKTNAWLKYPSVNFRIFPVGHDLIWFQDCGWAASYVRWNPSNPDHNPSKIKIYKGITIDGDTAYVNYKGNEIPFDIVERDGDILTLVYRTVGTTGIAW